jgi:16S rRNA (uracil1498-N3)-methyltransferase
VLEPAVHVVLAIGLLKGDQMDAVVRDATMLGVAAIEPLITAHVAVAGKARESDKAVARWLRVAVASAKQSGRAVVPRIDPPAPLATVLRENLCDELFIAVEPRAARAGIEKPANRPPKKALVLVGPEGGWSDEEIGLARSAGAQVKQLGPRTLRAEAAPIVLLSALWTEWGWP